MLERYGLSLIFMPTELIFPTSPRETPRGAARAIKEETEELTRISRILVSYFRAICAIRVSILSCSPALFLSSLFRREEDAIRVGEG